MNILFLKSPKNKKLQPEQKLWWSVIRQAADDIETGYEQQALDAYEFLSSTGLWMLIETFGVDEDKAIEAIANLVRSYNGRADRPLPVGR